MKMTIVLYAGFSLISCFAAVTVANEPSWADDPLFKVSKSLVSWLPADGHSYDLAGILHGKPSRGIVYGKGRRVAAFSFPGGAENVAVGSPQKITNTFTIAVWVRPSATWRRTTDRLAGTRGQRYAIYPAYGGRAGTRAGCGISVGTNGVSVFEHTAHNAPCVLNYTAPVKGWTHVAVAYDKRVPSLFVNGKAAKTGKSGSRWTVFPGTTLGDPAGNYGPFQGEVDDYMLFGRALIAKEVQAVMRATLPNKRVAVAAKKLSDEEFAKLQTYLSGEQARRSLFAVHRLAQSGDDAVRRLRPLALKGADTERRLVKKLIIQLDSDSFRKREQATARLIKHGKRRRICATLRTQVFALG